MLATEDGGATWHTQAPPPGYSFLVGLAVDFRDQSRGWVAPWGGDPGGGVLATTDGGQTWRQQATNGVYYMTGVDFISASEGWAAGYVFFAAPCSGYQTHLFHTVDGGASWTEIGTACGFSGEVDFADGLRGALISYGQAGTGHLLVTTDGGTTWGDAGLGPAIDARNVQMLDAQNGWVVGAGGTILHFTLKSDRFFLPFVSR
jgi:photosystem II stability/assembly factor-like uncharacterized protein